MRNNRCVFKTQKMSGYLLTNFIGEGSFGTVLNGYRLPSLTNVAVKCIRKEYRSMAMREINVLKKLRCLDPDKCNLVKCYGYFKQGSYTYIAMEKLNTDIHNYMENHTYLPVDEIRVILHQTLVALNALKSIGLVHLDIKPDNIMLSHEKPLKVKLIDFGLASDVSEIEQGFHIQPTGYTAPEVTLGLPVTTAVDMWSLGCVAAFMYINSHLFPIQDPFEELSIIIKMQGQPAKHVLDKGMYTKRFFWKKKHGKQHTWQLKTRDEYMTTNSMHSEDYGGISEDFHCVDDLLKMRQDPETVKKWKDNRAFLSLLKRMLHTDPAKRITPIEALGHQFLTMRHFPNKSPTDPSELPDVEEPTPSTSCSFVGQNNIGTNTNNTNNSTPKGKLEKSTLKRMTWNIPDKSRPGDKPDKARPGDKPNKPLCGDKTDKSCLEDKPNKYSQEIHSQQHKSGSDRENTGFSTNKTQKTLLTRIRNFFFRILRPEDELNKSCTEDKTNRSSTGHQPRMSQ